MVGDGGGGGDVQGYGEGVRWKCAMGWTAVSKCGSVVTPTV